MRRKLVLVAVVAGAFLPGVCFGQEEGAGAPINAESAAQAFDFASSMGFGVKTIDGDTSGKETFYNLHFAPEINVPLGPTSVGLGLNLDVDLDHEFKVRDGQYNERTDWWNLLRFFRIGRKGDLFYGRVGILDSVDLGYRTIVNHLRSDVDYDTQKIGAELAMDFDAGGFEAFTNNFGFLEVLGGRAYARPLSWVLGGDPDNFTGLLERLEIGATYVTDQNAPALLNTDPLTGTVQVDRDGNLETDWRPTYIWGVDVGLPLLPPSWAVQITPFVDYSKIIGHGQGESYGVIADLKKPMGLDVDVRTKLERRETTDEYVPGYFDAFYEVERFRYPELDSATTKRTALDDVRSTRGVFGELSVNVMGMVTMTGSYLDLFGDKENGEFTLEAALTGIEQFRASAQYIRRGIRDATDILEIRHDQAWLRAQLGYAPYPAIAGIEGFGFWLTMNFERTWRFDETRRRYEAVDIVTPGVSLDYQF